MRAWAPLRCVAPLRGLTLLCSLALLPGRALGSGDEPGIKPTSRGVERLRPKLGDPDPSVRRATVLRLGRLRGPRVVELLGEVLLRDKSAGVRLAAVKALRRHGEAAYPWLRRAADEDADPRVSRAALVAAKPYWREERRLRRERAGRRRWEEDRGAMQDLLGSRRVERGESGFHGPLVSQDPAVRLAAVKKLARQRGDPATTLLGEVLLQDRSPEVRLAAVRALRRRGAAARPWLTHAADKDPDSRIRRAARMAMEPGWLEEPGVAGEARSRRPRSVRVFLGAGMLGTMPLGSWNEHPYSGGSAGTELDYFGVGAGGRIELGLGWPRWLAGLTLEIGTLSTGEWVDYCAERGDRVEAQARALAMYGFGALQIISRGPIRFDVHLGTGFVLLSGEEQLKDLDLDYNYTFFHPALSFRQGVSFSWLVVPHIDVVLGIDHSIAIGGVQYAGASEEAVWSLSLNLGVRYWPVRRRKR